MPTQAAFYFAWVEASETVWGFEHQRVDEDIASLSISGTEGQAAILTIVVRNPRIGLNHASRKSYCQVAWDSYYRAEGEEYVGIVPLFFGWLEAIATDLVKNEATLTFYGQASDYDDQRQRVAETLKVRPFYDPVFLDAGHQDDPDSILEGRSALWDSDRVTGEVSITDILVGEDGVEVFEEDEVPHDTFTVTRNTAPLTDVYVRATVEHSQRASGTIPLVSGVQIATLTDSLMSGWPKAGASFSGGWSVASASATDKNDIANTNTVTHSFDWQNKAKHHREGDTMSISISDTVLSNTAGVATTFITSADHVAAVVDTISWIEEPGDGQVFGSWENFLDQQFDNDSDIIQPTASANVSATVLLKADLSLGLNMRYDADRKRTETVAFKVHALVQDVIASPQKKTEIIQVSGVDVSEPLQTVLFWEAVKNTVVKVGTIIFPNNPDVLGGEAYQVCTTEGLTGNGDIPTFSQIIGEETVDNAAVWTSLGDSLGTTADDWQPNTLVEVGLVIRPLPATYALRSELNDTSVSEGTITRPSDSKSYQVATTGGQTALVEPTFNSAAGSTTTDNDAVWTSLGPSVPDGNAYFVCVQEGITGTHIPPFSFVAGDIINDGTAKWKALGSNATMLGIPIGDVSRPLYFTTDRGQWSIEYLICVARAHLRNRARVIQIAFDCKFERAIYLTCRKNARIYNRALPGGVAEGKITSYEITADGDTGILKGKVSIACAVGLGGLASTVSGTGNYFEPGYIAQGYFVSENGDRVDLVAGQDIGYSRPVDAPDDDGITFPLTYDKAVISAGFSGPSVDDQIAAVIAAVGNPKAFGTNPSIADQTKASRDLNSVISDTLKGPNKSISYSATLRPVAGVSFSQEFDIHVTDLAIPLQIDLSAPSNA